MDSSYGDAYRIMFDRFVIGAGVENDPATWLAPVVRQWREHFAKWNAQQAADREPG